MPRGRVQPPGSREEDRTETSPVVARSGGVAPHPGQGLVAHLQGTAGNRAVATMLGRRSLQRHVGPTVDAEVGGAEPGTGTGTGSGAPAGPDYAALAEKVRDAIEGLGTDEEAVYAALGALGRDPVKIMAFSMVYLALTGRSIEADIDDDFSGSELQRAMKLITAPNRQEQIESQMRLSASGLWALEVISKHKIEVDWEYTGTGSFHQAGKIFLNKNTPPNAAAITMMHEAQHALTFKTGKSADAAALSKADFVKAKIADEAEAVVRAIEGAAPMQAGGIDISGSGVTPGLITQYQTALATETKALTDADPKMAAADASAQARTKVRDGLVTNWFHDGTFVTSTGNITYSAHYGNYWDSVHAPPASPATLPVEAPTPVVNA